MSVERCRPAREPETSGIFLEARGEIEQVRVGDLEEARSLLDR